MSRCAAAFVGAVATREQGEHQRVRGNGVKGPRKKQLHIFEGDRVSSMPATFLV